VDVYVSRGPQWHALLDLLVMRESYYAILFLVCLVTAHTFNSVRSRSTSSSVLFGKKNKNKTKSAPSKAQKQGQADRFDALTRQYMFTCSKLNKVLPDGSRQILKNINLCFYPGAKIGVVGLNGSGKSSLMKIMAGQDTQFDGEAVPMPGASIGYLPQEPILEGKTVMDNIDMGVAQSQLVLDKFNDLSLKLGESLSDDEMQSVMDELNEVQNKIDAGNMWEIDRVKQRAMDALRCPSPDQDVSVLSGGERRRVAIARLLLENHDMLLLDEPTNHLDAESIAWLEKFLQDFKGTVVGITHDRYFLENSCSWILELDRGEGIPYEGNYSGWLEKKQARLEQEKKEDDKLKKNLASELEWVRSNPKARQTKSKSRMTRYEEMVNTPAREGLAHSATIYIPPGPRLGDTVIEAKGITKAYGDKLLMKDLSFSIPPGAIVGVVGANGAGKSTLIKMIQGKVEPDSGDFTVGPTVKLAVADQDRDSLNAAQSVFDEVSYGADFIQLGSQEVNSRAYCSWFGFKGTDQQKLVGKLSGGERNRCQLAKVVQSGANVLLLDEPTNDLDVDTIRSLEEALLDFGGCAVVVSHDRFFLDRICTHIMAFEGDSKVNFFEGNHEDYVDWKKEYLGIKEEEPKPLQYAKLA
jgi:energy-dependent translational throttle protein EttA